MVNTLLAFESSRYKLQWKKIKNLPQEFDLNFNIIIICAPTWNHIFRRVLSRKNTFPRSPAGIYSPVDLKYYIPIGCIVHAFSYKPQPIFVFSLQHSRQMIFCTYNFYLLFFVCFLVFFFILFCIYIYYIGAVGCILNYRIPPYVQSATSWSIGRKNRCIILDGGFFWRGVQMYHNNNNMRFDVFFFF